MDDRQRMVVRQAILHMTHYLLRHQFPVHGCCARVELVKIVTACLTTTLQRGKYPEKRYASYKDRRTQFKRLRLQSM